MGQLVLAVLPDRVEHLDRHCRRGADRNRPRKYTRIPVDTIDYKDLALIRRFISDRGKIRARRVTGNCVQHQRDVATAVKNAREVALLPYTSTAR